MEPSNAQGRPTQLNWGRPAALVGRGGSRAIIAVITIINEELQAVLAQDTFASVVPGTPYLYRHEISKNVYDVVVAQAADQTNVPCGNLVNRIVEHLRPEFIILCGIAGGMAGKWGIELGNVVVADHVEGYEQQKRSANKVLLTRLALDHPSFYLRHMVVGRVRQVSAWRSRIKAPRPVDGVPDIREGNLIAGDKLLGDGQNLYQRDTRRIR
jgi:nucleoside phosphorylase